MLAVTLAVLVIVTETPSAIGCIEVDDVLTLGLGRDLEQAVGLANDSDRIEDGHNLGQRLRRTCVDRALRSLQFPRQPLGDHPSVVFEEPGTFDDVNHSSPSWIACIRSGQSFSSVACNEASKSSAASSTDAPLPLIVRSS
jgi:hypothetical protein